MVTIFSIALIISPVSSQYHDFYCEDKVGNYAATSAYQYNLNLILPNLANKASLSRFNTDMIGEGIDQTYGLYMCRGDINEQQCHDCVQAASLATVQHCPVQKEAIVWYEQCMVRYANRSIFSHEDESYWSSSSTRGTMSDIAELGQIVSEAVDDLIAQAAYNTSSGGYAIGQAKLTLFEDVYVFAQCTPDILGSRCERCLRVALRNMAACCGMSRIRLAMYLPSCWLRYDEKQIVGKLETSSLSPPSAFNFPRPLPNDSALVPPGKFNEYARTIEQNFSLFFNRHLICF